MFFFFLSSSHLLHLVFMDSPFSKVKWAHNDQHILSQKSFMQSGISPCKTMGMYPDSERAAEMCDCEVQCTGVTVKHHVWVTWLPCLLVKVWNRTMFIALKWRTTLQMGVLNSWLYRRSNMRPFEMTIPPLKPPLRYTAACTHSHLFISQMRSTATVYLQL